MTVAKPPLPRDSTSRSRLENESSVSPFDHAVRQNFGQGFGLPGYAVTGIRIVVAGALLLGLLMPESAASDTWYLIRFDEKPVGYEQVKVDSISDSSPPLSAVYRRTRIQLKRLGQDLTLEATLLTKQDSAGVLHSFDLQRVDGQGVRTERSGEYIPTERRFQIEEKVNATRRAVTVHVSGSTFSPIFTTWLPNRMAAARGRVSAPVFFPESAAVAEVTAQRKQNRSIRIGSNKSVDATQILFYPQLDPINSTTIFVDADGSVLRHEQRILGGILAMEKSTPEVAMSAVANRSLNLDVAAVIPVDRLLSTSGTHHRSILDLTLKDGFLTDIPETEFQKVERLSPSSIRVTLSRPSLPRPGISRTSRTVEVPQAATHWMPLDDPGLQRMAIMAAAGQTEPGEVCRRLEQFVNSEMKFSAFSTDMRPADDVAKSLRGDCTEHAVLLAALMRIKGIPSRIAAGIMHSNRQYGFVGHAWVEAFIHGQWIPFDSTRSGTEGFGTAHIKLADSEMPEELTNSIVLFLPVLELAGRASIKVVSDQ